MAASHWSHRSGPRVGSRAGVPMNDERPPDSSPRPPLRSGRYLWLLFALLALTLLVQFSRWRPEPATITYSQFEAELQHNNIAAVLVIPETRVLQGSLRQATRIDGREITDYRVVLPFTDPSPLVARLDTLGIRIEGGEGGSPWSSILLA